MELIRPFSGLGKDNANLAGGKGASLGEMTKAGISVPPGFVILAGAFERFLEEAELRQEISSILSQVDSEVVHTVDGASEKIKTLILAAKIPDDIASEVVSNFEKLDADFVAVRSSATAEDSSAAAWAGQLDTFLNTTEETLLENVQRCWVSLFTPRAIFYRIEKGMRDDKISVAVVVQKMVQSEVSGIAFSVHPVTEDYNQMIIEAGYGLGEAIVSGQVTPDSFVVEKDSKKIIDKNIAVQNRALVRGPAFDSVEVQHSNILKNVGMSVSANIWRELNDVEGGKPSLSDAQVLELADIVLRIEKHYGFPCDIEWAFEAGQFFITQSRPITTLSKKDVALGDKIEGQPDYVFMWDVGPNTIVQWASATALRDRRDVVGIDLSMLNYFDGSVTSTYMPASDLEQIKIQVSPRYLVPQVFDEYHNRYLKEKAIWWEWVRTIEKKDFTNSTSDELYADYKQFAQNIYDSIAHFWTSRPEVTFSVEKRLEEILKKNGQKDYLEDLATILTATEPDDIQKQLAALEKLSENPSDKVVLLHLSQFPWLMYGQFDEREAVDFLKERIAERQFGKASTEKKFNTADILQKLSDKDKGEVEYLSRYLRTQSHERMEIKAYWAGCFWLSRNMLKRIASLLDISVKDMLSFLVPPEILGFLASKLKAEELHSRIEARRGAYLIVRPKGGELKIIDGDEAQEYFKNNVKPIALGITEITGQTASRGRYTGRVRKVKVGDLNDLKESIREFQKGEVLVTSMTQPNMMVLASRAGAIIADEGGIASHAAIIARELGIPCIVGCSIAQKVFKDGDMVEVDAEKGIVRLL